MFENGLYLIGYFMFGGLAVAAFSLPILLTAKFIFQDESDAPPSGGRPVIGWMKEKSGVALNAAIWGFVFALVLWLLDASITINF